MKYIRTKDGIMSTEDLVNLEVEDSRFKDKNIYNKNGVLFKALSQADTIEELCDEFVFVTPKGNKFIARKKMVDNKEYLLIDKTKEVIELKNIKDYLVDLYGAIWTSKGLIYVAKMNENGELELI